MGIFEDLVINHISDFFESGKIPETVIIKIIASMFDTACTHKYFWIFYIYIYKLYILIKIKKRVILDSLHIRFYKKYYPLYP